MSVSFLFFSEENHKRLVMSRVRCVSCVTCRFPNCNIPQRSFCAANQVLSPEGNGMTVACSEVILPSATGQLGILANHAPMMSALDTGVLRFKEDGKWKPVVVMGGFATVDSNQLSVLVNDFEEADSIDMKEAQSEMDGATSMLEKAESKKDKLEATAKAHILHQSFHPHGWRWNHLFI